MNIFVAKLNYQTTVESLREAFEQYGTVSSCKIIMDRDTGRSKGFGFVEMDNDDEALDAIDGLDNATIDGRNIAVNKAKPRSNSGDRRGGGGGGFNRRRY